MHVHLKKRLEIRTKAFVSDPDLITGAVLDLAVAEALELAGTQTALPVLVDIAHHRLLLQLGIPIDEAQHKAYRAALSQVTDPDAPSAPTASIGGQRTNPYR